MPNFTCDYLVFDEFGEKEILCMSCSKTIKSRQEIKSDKHQGQIVREMSKHAEYREIPVILSDGNIAFIMVCDDCKFSPISEEDAANITKQISEALKTQLIHNGKPVDVVDEIIRNINRKVVRKAETYEAARAMKGV